MKTLFHGSTLIVERPRVDAGRANLDFGPAFYLTDIRLQAEKWATRPLNRRKEQWLSFYSFDNEAMAAMGMRCLKFDRYDERWLDFIAASRNGESPWQGYDYIEGGLADDRLFDTIEEYLDGRIEKAKCIERLILKEPNNQIAILNQEIINRCLTFEQAVKLN